MESPLATSNRAGRPLVSLCAAVVIGSWLGHALEWPWIPLIVASALGWIACLALVEGDGAAARAALLVLCGAIAGGRADLDREVARAEAEEAIGRAGASTVATGTWDPVRNEREERARLDGRNFAAPIGLVAPGESIVLVPGSAPREWPRGPIPGPRATSPTPAPVIGATDVEPDEIVRVGRAPSGLFASSTAWIDALREDLIEEARALREPTTRGLVLALLFGDTSALPEGLPDLFVRTGTYHILAVSGMQVVLVVLFWIVPLSHTLAAITRIVGRGRVRVGHPVFALGLLALFVPIAGGGAPVVRSALGAGFALVAWNLWARRDAVVEAVVVSRDDASGAPRTARVRLARRADSLSCWSLALTLECVLHSDAPRSLSVQLSYAATLGLIVGTGPILRAWRGVAGSTLVAPVSRYGRERSPWWRVPTELALAGLQRAVAASLAAVLATLPFTWDRLGEWSPSGVLATPALGPSMTVLLVLGWLHVLTGGLVPEAALTPFADAMTASMRAFDALPFTPAGLPPRPMGWVLFACVATFVALWDVDRRDLDRRDDLRRGGLRRGRAWRVAAATWAVVIVPWNPAPARVEVHALDVGAGTAVVIDGPGLGTWIFDAGSRDRPDVAREAVGPLLRHLDPGSIGVVLSHEDTDHDGALPWIVERFDVAVFAGARPAHVDERLPHTCARIDARPGRVPLPALRGDAAGVQADLERGLAVEGNEGSRSVRLVVAGEEALLCGDAEQEGLSAWIEAFGGPADRRDGAAHRMRFVLWPHHGSDTDRLAAFLAATQPPEVWISSTGVPAVHAELSRRAIETKCTSRDGPLRATMPGGTVPAAARPP